VPEFLPALDWTLELEANVTSTNSPTPKAIGPGKGLEERMSKLGNPSMGSECLGWGRASPSKLGRSSRRRPPPCSHSPPRLNLGWVSLMPPHQFRLNYSSCHSLGRLGAELCPPPRVGKTALCHPITLVWLRVEPAHTSSVFKFGPSILSPTVIIQW
jgi:hypothetical protein